MLVGVLKITIAHLCIYWLMIGAGSDSRIAEKPINILSNIYRFIVYDLKL